MRNLLVRINQREIPEDNAYMRFGIGEQITAIGVRGKQLGCSFASSILWW
jgi:hypothetical protein